MTAPLFPSSRGFASRQQALEHLCDHVLTRAEAHDWSLILPEYDGLVDPTADRALEDFARRLFSKDPFPEGESLLDSYLRMLRQSLADARKLGWWWEQRSGRYAEWCGFGLDGVFVVWDAQVIKTGFLLRSAEPPHRGPPPDRESNPLPRRRMERRMPRLQNPSPEVHYRIFRENLVWAAGEYARRYPDIATAGSDVFVNRPPRFGRWQEYLAMRNESES